MSRSCLVSAWNSCFVTLESSSVAADVEQSAVDENAGGLKIGRSSDLWGRLKPGVSAETHLRLCASLQVEAMRVTFILFCRNCGSCCGTRARNQKIFNLTFPRLVRRLLILKVDRCSYDESPRIYFEEKEKILFTDVSRSQGFPVVLMFTKWFNNSSWKSVDQLMDVKN